MPRAPPSDDEDFRFHVRDGCGEESPRRAGSLSTASLEIAGVPIRCAGKRPSPHPGRGPGSGLVADGTRGDRPRSSRGGEVRRRGPNPERAGLDGGRAVAFGGGPDALVFTLCRCAVELALWTPVSAGSWAARGKEVRNSSRSSGPRLGPRRNLLPQDPTEAYDSARCSPSARPARSAIGDLEVGGDAPIAVQSMAATRTQDVAATRRQIELHRGRRRRPRARRRRQQGTSRRCATLEPRVDAHHRCRSTCRRATASPRTSPPRRQKIRYNPGHLHHHERDKPIEEKVAWLAEVAREHDLRSCASASTRARSRPSTRSASAATTSAPSSRARSTTAACSTKLGFHDYRRVDQGLGSRGS